MSLSPALAGERFVVDGISVYSAGQGPPLLLVHSVNAAASAAEVRPLFEHGCASRTVFAVDLPGYGFSQRTDRAYTSRLMTDALHTVAAHIAKRCGPAPLDALAVSLSTEFVARAAVEQPAHWGRLALVSPTGLNGRKSRHGPPGSSRAVPGLHRVLSQPLWAQALFNALSKPPVVRYFLERTWGQKDIDEVMCAYAVSTARAPGARFAPLHFLSGGMFSADIHTVYQALQQPVWMSHGVRGDFTDYKRVDIVKGRTNWQFSIFQTGALPYFEVPLEFNPALDLFLAGSAVGSRV